MNFYDVKYYHLDLKANDTSTFIEGSAEVYVQFVNNSVKIMTLELSDSMKIDSILVEQQNLPFSHADNLIIIDLQKYYSKKEYLKVKIYYKGFGEENDWFGGINSENYYYNNQPITYALSEPLSSKCWFPCKQVLSDKADSVFVSITVDPYLNAASNGILADVVNLPDGKLRYEWKSYYPTAYYLIAFAVSDFKEYNFYVNLDNETDSLLINNFIINSNKYLNENKEIMNKTGDIIKLYSKLYGEYPFSKEKYGQVLVPFSGGMENQTITFLWKMNFELISHELAHQWFGDNVTCATWQDVWINEGFATYSEYLTLEHLPDKFDSGTTKWLNKTHLLAKGKTNLSLYIPENELNDWYRIFDYNISYSKGASVIHMIRHELKNDSLFFQVLREFQLEFADSVATGLDFKNTLEEKSKIDFSDFFNQWYFGAGYPKINIIWNYNKSTLILISEQTVTTPDITPLFNIPIDIKLSYSKADTVITYRQTSNYDTIKIPFPYRVRKIEVDPENWLLYDLNGLTKDHTLKK